MPVQLSQYQFDPRGRKVDEEIDFLVEKICDPTRGWDLRPHYQRDYVWTDAQARRFLGHFLSGGLVPPIYAQRNDRAEGVEVIDGQQRLTSMIRFVKGEIPAEIVDLKGQRVTLWWKDFDRRDQRSVPSVVVVYVDLEERERLQFYLRLNSEGTPHTREELDRVARLLEAHDGN